MTKGTLGTKEWATSNINIQKGCKYGCLYCYALRMAIRFKRVKDHYEWINPVIFPEKVNKKYSVKRKGRIMFPSTHDIYHENYEACLQALKNILKPGNEVLITTKPHPKIIDNLTRDLLEYKSQIQFRFTITTIEQSMANLFEPFTPSIEERIEALKIAHLRGWKTSVSIEPYLDERPALLISTVEPYCTESIWIGIMSGNCNPYEYAGLDFKDRYKEVAIFEQLDGWKLLAKGKLRLKDSIKKMIKNE